MRWRAMRYGGGNTPAAQAADDPLHNSRQYINLVSNRTGKTYRCGLMEPAKGATDKTGYVCQRVQSGAGYSHEAVKMPLFSAEMMGATFGFSPPCHGVGDTPSAELVPNNLGGVTYPIMEDKTGIWLDGRVLTDAEVVSELFEYNFRDIVAGGTSLFDIAIEDAKAWIAETPKAFMIPRESQIRFTAEGTSYYWQIGLVPLTVMVGTADYDRLAYRDGLFDYLKPEALDDLGIWGQINYYGRGQAAQGTSRVGYGPGTSNQTRYEAGVSGFAQYGPPHAYIFQVDGRFGVASDAVNNYWGTGGVSGNIRSWPYVKGAGTWTQWGINPIDNPDYDDGSGAGVIQYRVPGWARMRYV